MMRKFGTGAALASALLAGSLLAAGALKSGPQVGDKIPGAFEPLHCSGPDAGEKICLV